METAAVRNEGVNLGKARGQAPLEAVESQQRSVSDRVDRLSLNESGAEPPKFKEVVAPASKEKTKKREPVASTVQQTEKSREAPGVIETTVVRLLPLTITVGSSTVEWSSMKQDIEKAQRSSRREQTSKKKKGKKAAAGDYLGVKSEQNVFLKPDCDSKGRKSLWLAHQVFSTGTGTGPGTFVFESLIAPGRFLAVTEDGSSLMLLKRGFRAWERGVLWLQEIEKEVNDRKAVVTLVSSGDFQMKVVRKRIDASTLAGLEEKEKASALKRNLKPRAFPGYRTLPPEEGEHLAEASQELFQGELEAASSSGGAGARLSDEEMANLLAARVQKKKADQIKQKKRSKSQELGRGKERAAKRENLPTGESPH